MTDRVRLRIEVGLIALLFGAGAGWGAFQWQLSTMQSDLKEVKERVAAMYCSTIPEPQRAACR